MKPLIPAIDTAIPHPWKAQSKLRQKLAKSLVCYVAEDDYVLSRLDFLNTVKERIESDLQHKEY